MNPRPTHHWPLPTRRVAIALLLWLSLAVPSPGVEGFSSDPGHQGLQSILHYISTSWDTLTRSLASCASLADPKLAGPPVLYLPDELPLPPAIQELQLKCQIRVLRLPGPIRVPGEIDPSVINPPGLLYLPHPYVVPGGRFNEMYGWDSYFIIRGLLRDGRLALARGMVENFFFEIEHYGAILNANRTYYLTRSQPPFLTSMVLAVYQADKAPGLNWLGRAYEYAVKDHDMWAREPHLAGDTGLSRYYDLGQGPVPEGLQDETGYYRGAAAYFFNHPEARDHYLLEIQQGKTNPDAIGFTFGLELCEENAANSGCDRLKSFALSKSYYKGDRAMRESGFDVSFRFAPYGAATPRFAPVCLNSLLYKTEKDLEKMSMLLGKKGEAQRWRELAERRRARVQQLLWDAKRGLFFDYDFQTKSRSTYDYATTFYPLWAGLATAEQARAVAQHLSLFEKPGGLAMSTRETGVQWDLPYGWAPIQLLAVEGLRRYGFNTDADRIAGKFVSMVAGNFRRDGAIREKYNVVTRSSETQVTAGYRANVVGFGWTNGVFLELLHAMEEKGSTPHNLERRTEQQSRLGGALHVFRGEAGRHFLQH